MHSEQYLGLSLAGRYQLRAFLGEGGMGMVFKADDQNLSRQVAVKLLKVSLFNSDEYIRRFEQEAHTIANLEHPSIVSIYDYGVERHNGIPIAYIVMQLLRRGTLTDRIVTNSDTNEISLPVFGEVVRIVKSVAQGLHFAHQKHVIHRDIKPTNVLFDDQLNPKIVDFGISRLISADQRITLTGRMLGTPQYMAPEQWGPPHDVVAASDQYALAVLTFQLLSGRTPFTGESWTEQMQMHLNYEVPNICEMRAELPEAVVPVLKRALSKKPVDRYPDVLEFARDFERVMLKVLRRDTDELDSLSSMSIPISHLSASQADPEGATLRENPLKALRPTPGNARLVLRRAPGLPPGTEWEINVTPFLIGSEGGTSVQAINLPLPASSGVDPIQLQIIYNEHNGAYILTGLDTKAKTYLGRQPLPAHATAQVKPGQNVEIRLGNDVELRLIVTQPAVHPLPDEIPSDTTIIIDDEPPFGRLEVITAGITLPKQRWTVQQSEFRLGRSKECDACFEGIMGISAIHALLRYENGKYYLLDQESRNGTSLNGTTLQPHRAYPLEANQTYRIGLGQRTVVEFSYKH